MPEDWSIYSNALVNEAAYFLSYDLLESFKKQGQGWKAPISKQPDDPAGSDRGILQASIQADGGDGSIFT